MVHALELTHRLLKPGGLLIDIHPCGEPPAIEAHIGGKFHQGEIHLAGYLDETDDFVEYFQADAALADVIGRGLFIPEREELFAFYVHATTITDLAEFLAAEWQDAVLHAETIERAEALMGAPGEGKGIVLNETIRITRLRASGG